MIGTETETGIGIGEIANAEEAAVAAETENVKRGDARENGNAVNVIENAIEIVTVIGTAIENDVAGEAKRSPSRSRTKKRKKLRGRNDVVNEKGTAIATAVEGIVIAIVTVIDGIGIGTDAIGIAWKLNRSHKKKDMGIWK